MRGKDLADVSPLFDMLLVAAAAAAACAAAAVAAAEAEDEDGKLTLSSCFNNKFF